ncbi:MAG: response regulator [Treponema sp.]|nr:response regulator [Treponema sp.]
MELLKLLIADDEENIRNGLKCILDWQALGYKFCGEASNGKDTINQIIDLKPDLVILDIKMPGLTGIEVISQTKSYFQKHNMDMPAFLILSGYSEFEYAQKTINLGAKAYLLKPVDEDQLQEKVLSIAKEINEHKIMTDSYKNTELISLRDYLLRIVQNEEVNPDELAKISFFDNLQESFYQVAIFFKNYCPDYDSKEFKLSFENYFSFFNYQTLKTNDKIIIIFKTNNEPAIKNCLERASKLSNKTFISLGKSGQGIEGIKASYKEALDLERYLFFMSDYPYISTDIIPESGDSIQNKESLDKIINNLIFCIETYDKKQLEAKEMEFDSYLSSIKDSSKDIKKYFIYLIIELRNKLSSKYPERDISDGESYEIVPKFLEMTSYKDSFQYFKMILNNFIENFNFNTSDSVIVKVIAYIKSNYSEDLKLETLGDMFNCNSAYLGKKFKKYTGLQFNTYLDNLRIEEAKNKIQNTDLKIYQISKLVGYANTDYFFMKFKKNTGYTPKEYKKILENQSQNDEN